ncbi:unnamed protein product (macronuclear) [Paramecium tetraurelia]|uniref:Uncharacterized protein n=1 Tax=Paramecium tetraurelia TaxID=5888 RepID=A0CMZ0_PARTE|nr:uncharacterized protein GSPATT00008598001 [Paramecium tetraurelia]CAK72157.1 unnamed protein product [Paramecium tetraurelia]|eukprot:XP_001439554.1 hypothetical protein (macronuclear) [Paramecium tetraurelia strain d4-2]
MSKGFALNLKNDNVMTFEQENELYAGQSIKVYHTDIIQLKFKQEEKQFELEFKVGQDVEWAKKCVAEILDCGRNDFVIQLRNYVNRT